MATHPVKPPVKHKDPEGLTHLHDLYKAARERSVFYPTPDILAEESRLHRAYVSAIIGQLPEGNPDRCEACGLSKTKATFCLMGGFH